ncbi:MAG: DUF1553 domain-containing protein [Planctomycetales bacterium]|nr:DUF1553 domain-containing protein [Planctomycetales bacterium]
MSRKQSYRCLSFDMMDALFRSCLLLILLNLTLLPGQSAVGEDSDWWAFQPLEKPALPEIESETWSQNPIDRFVYQRMAEREIQPAPQADWETLVRRLYFDLLGLPPTPEQIEEFTADQSPGAWERLVDRILADPRYGEHWARFWLDLVRYAESDGWNKDSYRPHIWRYRDYVVQSFNDDKPYPEFVMQQLAGDEIEGDDPENLIATGFLRLGIYEYNQRDARAHWNDIMNETTDVVGDVFLGMGMACARCHDHKFDPILQTDYFRLRAFFEPLVWQDDVPGATKAEQASYEEKLAVWKAATAEIQQRIDALLDPYREQKWESTVEKFPLEIQACYRKASELRSSWEHQMAYLIGRQFVEEGVGLLEGMKKEDKLKHEELLEELAAFDGQKPEPLPEVMSVSDARGPISPTVIPDDYKATPIEPGYLSVLSTAADDAEIANASTTSTSGRRTALAEWIGRADNPLTTRVIVNRIWQQHFGQGIVSSASDFGHMGRPPSHPQLLDWLTTWFIENGWSIKSLHRQILTSATWKQSSFHPESMECQARDPAGELLWRAPIRRLKAEQNRDAMLAVSGELQEEVGGPSVAADVPRRSLYVKVMRNTPDPLLQLFDASSGLSSVAQRNTTTTPTQSLLMINGDFALARARHFAERLLAQQQATIGETLDYGFRLAWGRGPTAEELAKAIQFLGQQSEEDSAEVDVKDLAEFCHVLLNSNEFLYVD